MLIADIRKAQISKMYPLQQELNNYQTVFMNIFNLCIKKME